MSAVSTTNGTYLANLFNPQVVGDRIEKKPLYLLLTARILPTFSIPRSLVTALRRNFLTTFVSLPLRECTTTS